MIDRVQILHRQLDAYRRLLTDAPSTVARYYLSEIRKVEDEIEKAELEEKAAEARTPPRRPPKLEAADET